MVYSIITKPPKPPQKTKKQLRKEELERKRQEEKEREEAEKLRLEEEERLDQEKKRLQRIEEERLAKEERDRLKEERSEVLFWDETVMGISKQAEKEFNKRLEEQKISSFDESVNPLKESDLTTFYTNLQETKFTKLEEIEEILKKLQSAEDIAHKLNTHLLKFLIGNELERVEWCTNYIMKLRTLCLQKIVEFTAKISIVIDSDILIEEKLQEVANNPEENSYKQNFKGDERMRYEVLKIIPPTQDFKFGVWLNPNSKAGFRHKPVDFLELEIKCENPRPFMTIQLIMKALWTSFDPFSMKSPFLKEFIVGGVLNIECFEFLPLPKKTDGWSLKYQYKTNEALKKLNFPTIDVNGQLVFQQNTGELKVGYNLSPKIYIHPNDTIQVYVYDNFVGWTTENIEDEPKYDPEKKYVSFVTRRLAPFAIIHKRTIDYPYKGFKLRCINDETALLDIIGKRLNIRLEIGANFVILKNRPEPEFSHISNVKMSPHDLLYELYRCGINMLPSEDDFLLEEIQPKNFDAETHAIYDIIFAVRPYFIKSTRWNHSEHVDRNIIMARIHHNLEFDEEFAEDQEKDWMTLGWWPNKVAALCARDSQQKPNMKFLPDTLTHANLQILMRKHELASLEIMNSLRDTSHILFANSLKQVLRLTHVLAFSSEQ